MSYSYLPGDSLISPEEPGQAQVMAAGTTPQENHPQRGGPVVLHCVTPGQQMPETLLERPPEVGYREKSLHGL